jgi:hypothetical protein
MGEVKILMESWTKKKWLVSVQLIWEGVGNDRTNGSVWDRASGRLQLKLWEAKNSFLGQKEDDIFFSNLWEGNYKDISCFKACLYLTTLVQAGPTCTYISFWGSQSTC